MVEKTAETKNLSKFAEGLKEFAEVFEEIVETVVKDERHEKDWPNRREFAKDFKEIVKATDSLTGVFAQKELEELIKSKDWRKKVVVALNLNTPPKIEEQLANDSDWRVRLAVVIADSIDPENPKLSKETREKLANDSDYFVRWGVAALDPNISLEMREKLANDSDYFVRWGVATYSDIPEILEKLGNDSDWRVLGAVLKNPSTPLETKEKLFYILILSKLLRS